MCQNVNEQNTPRPPTCRFRCWKGCLIRQGVITCNQTCLPTIRSNRCPILLEFEFEARKESQHMAPVLLCFCWIEGTRHSKWPVLKGTHYYAAVCAKMATELFFLFSLQQMAMGWIARVAIDCEFLGPHKWKIMNILKKKNVNRNHCSFHNIAIIINNVIIIIS